MTGNGIRDEGAKTISEMLKVNTTLTSLNLTRMKQGKGNEKEQEIMTK